MATAIAIAAEEVLKSLSMWRLPVDPLEIARQEGIKLKPGAYRDGFDARIEYFPRYSRYGIYYRSTGVSLGRQRFSLGHELGHYYLPHHRQRLEAGDVHDSTTDFRSKNPLEREADQFAAELLMPGPLFVSHVKSFRQSCCTLEELIQLADRLRTSVTSTGIRYCDCNIEPATLVLSRDGIVQWTYASADMKPLGCWYVKSGTTIPEKSQTAKVTGNTVVGHRVDPHTWFDWPKAEWLYEEAIQLGDMTLTWLIVDE